MPCDAQGNILTNAVPDPNGFYTMSGTASGNDSNTYPAAMIYAAVQDPTDYGFFLRDSSPLTLSKIAPFSTSTIGSSAQAYNYSTYNNTPTPWIYGVPTTFGTPNPTYTSGLINGSITEDFTGQLVYYFKLQWSGMGNPTTPPGIGLLLKTQVAANAGATYSTSPPASGLSALATATDSNPFNEMVTAVAGDAGAAPNSLSSTGYHVVTAAVDPATKIAEVYLNGVTHAVVSDYVQFGQFLPPGPPPFAKVTNGIATGNVSSSVTASVKMDDRGVRIISKNGTTYHKGVAGQPAPNAPDGSGTLTDDMLKPTSGKPRATAQFGSISGYWGRGSGFKWSQQITGDAQYMTATISGTISGALPSAITPDYDVAYNYSGATSFPIGSHVSLAVKDGVDNAVAGADYYINFHNEYENLIPISDTQVNGTPVRVTPVVNSGPHGGTFTSMITVPVSVTVTCDLSGAAGLFVTNEYDVYDIGKVYTSATPRASPSFTMPINEYCWIEDTPFWHNNTGTIDNYEAQGFTKMLNFSLNHAYHSQSPLVDFTEVLRSSITHPVN